jgi:hypothetical protein
MFPGTPLPLDPFVPAFLYPRMPHEYAQPFPISRGVWDNVLSRRGV